MQIIPMADNGSRRITVDLGNDLGIHTFQTYYNYLADMWFMDLLDADDNAIISGLALAPFINVLRAHTNMEPIGELRVSDTSGDNNALPDSLGNTAQLVHYDPGEFDATYPDTGIRIPLAIVDLDDVLIT